MPTYAYMCGNGHRTEDFRSMSRKDEPMPCPVEGCGGSSFNTFIANEGGFNAWTLGTFGVHGGYYDRGLGRHVTSPDHRQEVMRELGVHEGGSVADTERSISANRARGEAIETEYNANLAELNRDPALLRARDQGRINFPTVPT